MTIQRLVSVLAIIASCHASGIGHFAPVVKSFPVVRYAPFFSFPNAGRSIHTVAPIAPAPIFPAPAPAPVFGPPAPIFSAPAPVFPAPAPAFPAPAPIYPAPAPAFPAPAFPGPVFHAGGPAPVPLPAPAQINFAPQPFFAPALPRLAPLVPTLPRIASLIPTLPRLAPVVPAYPPAPLFARAIHALPAAPISPIIRPAVAPAFAPYPVAVAKAFPFGLPAHAPHLHYAHAPLAKEVAWK